MWQSAAAQFWLSRQDERDTTHLGDGLLDLDGLARASATDLAGRGLLATTLRSEDGRGTDNGGCYRQ